MPLDIEWPEERQPMRIWWIEDVIDILNCAANSGRNRGPEFRQAILDIAHGFGVQDKLDLPTVDADYWITG